MMRFGSVSLLMSAARGAVLTVCRGRVRPGSDPVAVAELIVVELGVVARSVAEGEDESIGGGGPGVGGNLSVDGELHFGVFITVGLCAVGTCLFCCWCARPLGESLSEHIVEGIWGAH